MKSVKDVNPQFLNAFVTLSAANTFTEKSIQLPVNPAASIGGGKVRVIEILKVFGCMNADVLANGAETAFNLTYRSHAGIIPDYEPNNFIVKVVTDMQLVTSGAVALLYPYVADLTDGAGNGFLVCVPTIYLGAITTGQTLPRVAYVKILFRYKDIGTEEFIGIAQSQQ